MARFTRHEDIPELVPKCLLLPVSRPDLRVPQEPAHTANTTTPREIGYAFFTGSFSMTPEKAVLDILTDERQSSVTLFTEAWGNHVGRAIMRVMLDPDRLAPVDMVEVYRHELVLARFTNEGEEAFFKKFVELHGIVDRSRFAAAANPVPAVAEAE